MSIRVALHELNEPLTELIEDAVHRGEECIVERDGQQFAVIVGAGEWRRRFPSGQAAAATRSPEEAEEAHAAEIGRRLDELGSEYRLSSDRQQRLEALLAKQDADALTAAERGELEQLAERCDAIMLRRADALDRAH